MFKEYKYKTILLPQAMNNLQGAGKSLTDNSLMPRPDTTVSKHKLNR